MMQYDNEYPMEPEDFWEEEMVSKYILKCLVVYTANLVSVPQRGTKLIQAIKLIDSNWANTANLNSYDCSLNFSCS